MHMYAVELHLTDSHWTTKMSMDNGGGRCKGVLYIMK